MTLADIPAAGFWYLNIDPWYMFCGVMYCAAIDGGLSGLTLLFRAMKRVLHPDDSE